MILKFRQGTSWRFVDNITEADIIPVKSGEYFDGCIGAISYARHGGNFTQPFSGAAFLLNDNGKTIERLDSPSVHLVPSIV